MDRQATTQDSSDMFGPLKRKGIRKLNEHQQTSTKDIAHIALYSSPEAWLRNMTMNEQEVSNKLLRQPAKPILIEHWPTWVCSLVHDQQLLHLLSD